MNSPIQVGAWVVLGSGTKAVYAVDVENETAIFEFSELPGPGFTLVITRDALTHVIPAFSMALGELTREAGDADPEPSNT